MKIDGFELFSKINDLPDRERRIVDLIVTRLHNGLREYGSWEKRKHNNLKDMLEENLDYIAYNADELLNQIDLQKAEEMKK